MADLVARALLAFEPAGLVGRERGQAAVGKFSLAHDRLLFGPYFGKFGALARYVVAHLRKPGFDIGRGRKGAERAFRFGLGCRCFVAAHRQARARFRQR